MNTLPKATRFVIIITLFASASLLWSAPAHAKKLNAMLYDMLEDVLGAPTYQSLASAPGFYNGGGMASELSEVAARLNAVSKNQRLQDINILNSGDINAYAVPGGHIMILHGIYQMLHTRDELACVVGHELGHLEKRHSLKAFLTAVGIEAVTRSVFSKNKQETEWLVSQFVGFLYTMKLSRDDELEADTLGLTYVRDAGYDPRSCVDMMSNLAHLAGGGSSFTLLETHPPFPDRISNMQTWLAGNFNADQYDSTHDAYAHKPLDNDYDTGGDSVAYDDYGVPTYGDGSGDTDGLAGEAVGGSLYSDENAGALTVSTIDEYFDRISQLISENDTQKFNGFVLANPDLSRQAVDGLTQAAQDNDENSELYTQIADSIQSVLNSNWPPPDDGTSTSPDDYWYDETPMPEEGDITAGQNE